MKYLLILLLTGCTSLNYQDVTYKQGDKLVILKYLDTPRQVNNKCGFRLHVYGCTRYTPAVNTYVIYTLPVPCLVEHEKRHVDELDWHPPGWVDVECNKKVRMYLGG